MIGKPKTEPLHRDSLWRYGTSLKPSPRLWLRHRLRLWFQLRLVQSITIRRLFYGRIFKKCPMNIRRLFRGRVFKKCPIKLRRPFPSCHTSNPNNGFDHRIEIDLYWRMCLRQIPSQIERNLLFSLTTTSWQELWERYSINIRRLYHGRIFKKCPINIRRLFISTIPHIQSNFMALTTC